MEAGPFSFDRRRKERGSSQTIFGQVRLGRGTNVTG